ncbi:hypothetical protein SDC9_210698 [bioreactor metagenome]|uniref:Uncharacterized protein n=1 Tax=bioreactor metagenome TaxID=1076179 RepID=A0A645JGY7_9ZZZZ
MAVEFAHLVEDDGAFEPLAGHRLDVGPILGVLFDVGINLGIHLGIAPESGLVGRGGIAAGARWR